MSFTKLQKIVHIFTPNAFEEDAWERKELIVGIDEVGRGCLAGPVLAAAVILKPYAHHTLLRDSKTLSKEQLQEAYNWIIAHGWYATALFSPFVIDNHNIYEATKFAMSRALTHLLTQAPQTPHTVLVDAMPLTQTAFKGEILYFTKGESKSSSIAAASIIAKVTRDKLITETARSFPSFGFENHKGYATQEHKDALEVKGRSFIHRHSFTCLTSEKDFHENRQTSLFC